MNLAPSHPRFLTSFSKLILCLALFCVGKASEVTCTAQATSVTASVHPSPGSVLAELVTVNVVFSESVVGVEASDLLANGVAALSVVTNNPNDYSFTLPTLADGSVVLTWALNHGIQTAAGAAYAGDIWTYILDSQIAFNANFVISEFMASNTAGILDDDGNRSDWIEILNLGPQQASLDGWFLTDNSDNLGQWRFPLGMAPVPANGYLLVWASGKNRTNTTAALHTNFKLSSSPSYLALVSPNSNVVSAFSPYPTQFPNISYGRDRVDPSLVGYFTNSTPAKTNSISGGGFVEAPQISVESGVYTNETLLLTMTSAPGTTIRFTINGAAPLTNSTLYTNAIVLSNSLVLKVRAFPPSTETNLFPSPVVARNIIFLDNTSKDFSSELPIIVVSTGNRAVPSDVPPGSPRLESSLALIDTYQGRSSLQTPPDFIGNVGIEVFGQSSTSFPKLPYRIEIHDELGNDLSIPVFGLPAEADWKLRNPFDDKSLMNDYIGYELFEKMGHYSCRRRLVEVFIDQGGGRLKYPADYVGVEVLFESIKAGKNRVNISKIPPTATSGPEITGGFVFAKDKDSPGDLNFNTKGGGGFNGQGPLKLHEPKPNDLRPTPSSGKLTPAGTNQLNYLVNYLNRMERAMYTNTWLSQTGTNHYSAYLDVDSFVDFHLLVEFTKQIDGIRLSSYFTKDRGGKLQAGPVWDWNLSFGNANYWRGGLTNGWYYAQDDKGMNQDAHIWLRRLINGTPNLGSLISYDLGNAPGPGGDPDFNQRVSDRWSQLRTNLFNPTNIVARIDELAHHLNEAAQRDLWGKWRSQIVGIYVWPNPEGTLDPINAAGDPSGRDVDYMHPTNYLGGVKDSIIGQMKKFISSRFLWIDAQFTHIPQFSTPGGPLAEGTTITVTPPAGTTLYYTLDGTDPRLSQGGVSSSASSNAGPVTLTIPKNTRVFARAVGSDSWYHTWSGPSVQSYITRIEPIFVSEVMYHPIAAPTGSTNSSSDFEYIELINADTNARNLEHIRITGGINFEFPSLTLAPGERTVIVANLDAFRSRYPDSTIRVAGVFSGSLNNSGDSFDVLGSVGELYQRIRYRPDWYPATAGLGFSLVSSTETDPNTFTDQRWEWHPSHALGGSPGKAESGPGLEASVVVNELISHPSGTGKDTVELLNTGTQPIDISGWYLSDSANTPKKFRIPNGTVLSASGFARFTEDDFNPGGTGFGFNSLGESVYLFSADATGNLTGYAHGFSFGAQVADASFGRFVSSDGQEHFVTQSSPTLGAPNAGPQIGPVILQEIMYHPPDVYQYAQAYDNTLDEYVELRNSSSNPVSLFDTQYPANTWSLGNAVQFSFPTNVVIPAQGSVLVVSFDPKNPLKSAGFRQRFQVPSSVSLFGPWQGSLPNHEGQIDLYKPDVPVASPAANAGEVPQVLVESVHYRDAAPWPLAADGLGGVLRRVGDKTFADDPQSWVSGSPSPGVPVNVATRPVIKQAPTDVTVVLTNGANATFSVVAEGSGSLTYQWQQDGRPIPGANQSTLTMTNLNTLLGGQYNVVVGNPAGFVESSSAQLRTILPIVIANPPQLTTARPGASAQFSVTALSSTPIQYQWYFNGSPIPGARSATLSIPSAQVDNDGLYDVEVSDAYSILRSESVRLVVLINPVFVVQPRSQSVVRGGTVVLSAVVSNTATFPLTFKWKKVSQNLTTQVTNALVSYFVLSNLQASAKYSVTVSNLATAVPVSSDVIDITVLDDTDRDGIPDAYEALYPAFLNANDATDAPLDFDHDGMSNLAEYLAGTDPTDPKSYLRIESIALDAGSTAMELFARSNHSYVIEFTEGLGSRWQTLTNLLPEATEGIRRVVDPYPTSSGRLYRLATPLKFDRGTRTPVILQSPASVTAMQDDSVVLQAAAYGRGPLRYQWRLNGQDIPNTTNSSLSLPSIQPVDQGKYSVLITDDTGSVESTPAIVAVLEPPHIVSAPTPLTVPLGAPARFSVGATGNNPLTYRWLFNEIPIPGATGPVLDLPSVSASNAGYYRAVVSHSTANGVVSTKSEPVTLTILP